MTPVPAGRLGVHCLPGIILDLSLISRGLAGTRQAGAGDVRTAEHLGEGAQAGADRRTAYPLWSYQVAIDLDHFSAVG
jgi:hypothetical protein